MNTVTASFGSGITTKTDALWQYDYGQVLIIGGVSLPDVFEVHFTNKIYGDTLTVLGQDNQVSIPDNLLLEGREIYAYIYLHTGSNDGETEYKITIPVRSRPEPSDAVPTPVEQDIITQAIAALNDAVSRAESAANESESAVDNVQNTVESALQVAKDSGEFDGPKGDKGDRGEKGEKGDKGETGEVGPAGLDGKSYSFLDDGNGNITISEVI